MSERFSSNEGEDFLKEKYPDLPKSPEVESAVKRHEIREGEEVGNNPREKIGAYLDRLNEIFNPEDADKKERRVDFLKDKLHDEFVIKEDEIPESAFLLEQRIARELGHGDIEITQEFKDRKTAQIIGDQTKSLDMWVDYLSSPDAQYPDWAKYWAFRSVLKMGKLKKETDKDGNEKARFQNREKDTVAAFAPMNPRALAMTIGVMRSKIEEKSKPKKERKPVENKSVKLDDQDFQKLLSTESFSKIYTQFLIELPEYSTEGLKETRGEWVKYPQGADPTKLVKSLEGYPLEWCTANIDTARDQLQGGDFWVYYSLNELGEAKIPRLAIRMEGNHIAEDPRGNAPGQNLDPYIGSVLEEKLKDFGTEGQAYKKKSADMKKLTEIEKKFSNPIVEKLEEELNLIGAGFEEPTEGEWARRDELIKEISQINQEVELTKKELRFLYEMDSKIEGFGYVQDPRIKEVKEKRSWRADMSVIFDCQPNEIAMNGYELFDSSVVLMDDFVGKAYQSEMPENLKYIVGNANFNIAKIESLGKLEGITGKVDFSHSQVKDLGALSRIGGDVYFIKSKIENIGQLQSIGGDAYIDNDSKLDFTNVKIGERLLRQDASGTMFKIEIDNTK
ncbi:MAG: hypothetical protein EXS59_01780 [Candidatus Taylorbacteria bacterium]|nr:hypothetical protein [Candidatus Taylorbacteria bacterium]